MFPLPAPPLGAFRALAGVPALRVVGAAAIQGALARAGVAPADVTDVLMGTLQAGQARPRPARLRSMPAAAIGARRHPPQGAVPACRPSCRPPTRSGRHGLGYVAGGMENMSQAPYLLPKARDGYRIGHQQVVDSMITDGLWDPYHNLHMGSCAEQCAAK